MNLAQKVFLVIPTRTKNDSFLLLPIHLFVSLLIKRDVIIKILLAAGLFEIGSKFHGGFNGVGRET